MNACPIRFRGVRSATLAGARLYRLPGLAGSLESKALENRHKHSVLSLNKRVFAKIVQTNSNQTLFQPLHKNIFRQVNANEHHFAGFSFACRPSWP